MPQTSEERRRSQRERGHFEQVVEHSDDLYWADRTGVSAVRQRLRGRRIAAGVGLRPGERALDLGCGTGAYTASISESSPGCFVGVDVSPSLLKVARGRTGGEVGFLAADARELPFPDESFDAVLGNAVLHHLPMESALGELRRVLKPAGRFCFAEPNLLNPQVFVERNVPVVRDWLENSPDETAFVRWTLARALDENGFEGIEIVPFDFLYPLTPRRLSGVVAALGSLLERTPLVREIAGSLLIRARRPV